MLGKKNKINPNEKRLFLKIRSKDKAGVKIVPYVFDIQDKVGDKYVTREEPTDAVSGNLVYIHLDTYEHEKEEKHTVKLYLQDGDEVYITDLRYNNLTRGLYNSLLNLVSYDNLQINLYASIDKKTKVAWPAVSLWQADQTVKWKYQPSDLPDIIEHKIAGKIIKDSTELDAFFLSELTKLATTVKAAQSVRSPSTPTPIQSSESTPAPSYQNMPVEDPDETREVLF